MKNVGTIISLGILIFTGSMLAGCTAGSRSAAPKAAVSSQTSADKQATQFDRVIAQTKTARAKQSETIKQARKMFQGMGVSDLAFAPPAQVSDLAGTKNKNKAILVTGVVTGWAPHARIASNVYSNLTFLVRQQYTFKKQTDLTGRAIHVVHAGGMTTMGEQWDNYPKKDFDPVTPPTVEERKQAVFAEDASMVMPRIGDQVIMALMPYETEAAGTFLKQSRFKANAPFIAAHGSDAEFFLNLQTGHYESRRLTSGEKLPNDGRGQALTYDASATAVFTQDTSGPLHDNPTALLHDINARYAVK
ncbi:hypothetical protein [Schleiferilactobacillus shenzhenensis]|uniref:Lipoprotein n=1 Tax=Schleiferilactobacillus shenzhenensis LY-73 TaxID=1231336 RepID=U4TN97_9LACO|nr:hypothetical protein [Schleiferilactobacillus shenzhenensis]ERL64890.1 hypothetical protein L248_0494 [Schleiferilactobacillus shenzhenensis LY-73]